MDTAKIRLSFITPAQITTPEFAHYMTTAAASYLTENAPKAQQKRAFQEQVTDAIKPLAGGQFSFFCTKTSALMSRTQICKKTGGGALPTEVLTSRP